MWHLCRIHLMLSVDLEVPNTQQRLKQNLALVEFFRPVDDTVFPWHMRSVHSRRIPYKNSSICCIAAND